MNRILQLFILTFLLVTACTISPEKKFIGSWIETSHPGGSVTFKNDGTFIMGSNKTTLVGKWEITKDKVLNMLVVMDGEEIEYISDKFLFKGKDEIVMLSKTKEYVFKRTK